MKIIHKEDYAIIIITILSLTVLNVAIGLLNINWLSTIFYVLSTIFFFLILQFFRNPKRVVTANEHEVVAPADGKVVVIEEVVETEYFKDKRIQVSIFMSPVDVHVNRYPISGIVKFAKHHDGKYLVAWHPKSSTENERTTIVVENKNISILFRQIAGALAKRIVMYSKEGDQAKKGNDFGFIKFGSRVDLFFPLDTEIKVKLDQKVKGNKTVIASY